ncbi:MAG: hypothetical protein ACRD5Z_13635 [Bryobacteraceae bacterium]
MNADTWTKRGHPLRVMTTQAATFAAAMKTADPWRELVNRYPILVDIAQYVEMGDAMDASARLGALLDRYSHEWLAFWSVVHPAGALV